jgi:hypothetical protein
MKNILTSILIASALMLGLSSCIKNDDIVWNGAVAEWDLATYQTKATGLPFPIVANVPTNYGRAVLLSGNAFGAPADPALTRTFASTITMRVNLVGRPFSTQQVLNVRPNANFSTAVEGTHYQLLDRTCVIPKDSSFGYVRWQVLNPGTPAPGTPAMRVVFELQNNNDIKASENFKYLGWNIAQ